MRFLNRPLVNALINALVIVSVTGWLFSPTGVLGRVTREWLAAAERRRLVDELWHVVVDGPRIDSTNHGEVRIVEFADYECPFCRRQHPIIEQFLEQNPGVGIVFRHLPLTDIHPNAEVAARAAVCAEEQGRFAEMHEYLLEDDEWISSGDLRVVAEAASVTDLDVFVACLEGNESANRVAADAAIARELGITSTPSFVVESHGIVVGVQELADLKRLALAAGPEGTQ